MAEKYLENAEYPFQWDLDFTACGEDKNVMKTIKWKRDKVSNVFSRYIYSLAMFYEHACAGNLDESEKELHKCSDLMYSEDRMMQVYEPALFAIVAACKVHLKWLKSELNTGEDLVTITPLEELPKKQQAAIWGTRGYLLMEYGIPGTGKGKEWLEKAVEAEPEEAAWHLGLGRILFRLRSTGLRHKLVPTEREVHHLREAARLEEHPAPLVFLSTALLDLADNIKLKRAQSSSTPDRHYEEAHRCLLEAVELTKEMKEPQLLTRVARALDRLPECYGCQETAIQLFESALEQYPDIPMLNHQAGLAYVKRKEFENAEKYLQIAVEKHVFSAVPNLVYVRCQRNPRYDPSAFFEELLDNSPSTYFSLRTLERAAMYYYKRYQVEKATSYLDRAKLIDPGDPIVKEMQKKMEEMQKWRRRI